MRRKTRGDKPSGPRQSRTDAEFTVESRKLDLDDMTLGVTNIARAYKTVDIGTTPQMIFRDISIFNGFTDGFNSADNHDHGSKIIATDVTETDPTEAVYAVTPMAKEFLERIFPVLENVLQSGTGSRHTTSAGEIVRYFAMVIEAYALILNILKINHLAYHYDWKSVFPYTGIPPNFLYKLARNQQCTDVDLSQLWLPLMQRIERKFLFPDIVAEIKRQHMPMFPVNGAVLWCPFERPKGATGPDGRYGVNIYTRVEALLDYIDTVLNRTDSLLRTFLPFIMVDMKPWQGFATPSYDEERWTAWTNNGQATPMTDFAYDDSNDPEYGLDIVGSFNKGDDLPPSFEWFTHDAQPRWGRIRHASVYELIHQTGDDEGVQLTSHSLATMLWMGDDTEFGPSQATPVNKLLRSSTNFNTIEDKLLNVSLNLNPSLRRVYSNLSSANRGPLPEAGMLRSIVPLDAVVKNQMYDTQRYFGYDALRQLELMAAGSSLREVKPTLLGVALRHA